MQLPTPDRRQSARRTFLIECSWTRDARITDISTCGCFVDSRLVPREGEPVEFTATIEGTTVLLRGIAVNVQFDLGFGVRFSELSDEAQVMIHYALSRVGRPSGDPDW